MDEDARELEIFLDVQSGLPRQGPGTGDSTRRAVSLCRGLPSGASVLDIGCGPGRQTLVLAETLGAAVSAVDLHKEYLDELNESARAAGLAGLITPIQGDMRDLSDAPGTFDLIWSEGAAYIMGVSNALRTWKPLLKPGGYIGLSELVWTTDERPSLAERFFQDAYPEMKGISGNLSIFADCGYRVVGHFTLPEEAWWNDYYSPLEAKLPMLRRKYRGDDKAAAILAMTENEIDIRRRFGAAYGYEFFVARNPAPAD